MRHGRGVGDLSFLRRRADPERDRRSRSLERTGDVRVSLSFSLFQTRFDASLERPRDSLRSLSFVALESLTGVFECDTDLRLGLRSPPLEEEDDELDDEEDELLELDLDSDEERDELLSEELK